MADNEEVFRMKVTISAHETPELHARLVRAKEGRPRSALLKQLAQIQVLYPHGVRSTASAPSFEPAATTAGNASRPSGGADRSGVELERGDNRYPPATSQDDNDLSSLLAQSSYSKFL
jgi:hypothetical protein